MRSCILIFFPILLDSVVSAPWVLRGDQSTSHELESSAEHHGRPDRPPPPGIEGLEPSMGSENLKPFYQSLERSLTRYDQRQVTSLAGTGSLTTHVMTAAGEIGSLKARQTIQAFDHLHEGHMMPIVSLQALAHDTRQSDVPHDNATRPALNETHSPHEAGTNSSHLLNNQKNTSHNPATDTPPLMTDPPISFSAKPLPSDWTTITACTVHRSTKSPCTKSNNNKSNSTTSSSTTDTAAVQGCVTTVLAIHPHPCRNPKTVYTSTKTVHKSINCHGCTSLQVLSPMYGCPLITENLCERTMTAKTPYVWTSTVCEKLTALSQLTGTTKTSRHPKVTTAMETSRHMGATTLDTAQHTTSTDMTTTTPLVWPTSMEGLPWFGVSSWDS